MLDEKEPRETWREPQVGISSGNDHSEPPREPKGGVESDSVIVADGEDRTNFFVWILVACSSISGLLFGGFFYPVSSNLTLVSPHDPSHFGHPLIEPG